MSTGKEEAKNEQSMADIQLKIRQTCEVLDAQLNAIYTAAMDIVGVSSDDQKAKLEIMGALRDTERETHAERMLDEESKRSNYQNRLDTDITLSRREKTITFPRHIRWAESGLACARVRFFMPPDSYEKVVKYINTYCIEEDRQNLLGGLKTVIDLRDEQLGLFIQLHKAKQTVDAENAQEIEEELANVPLLQGSILRGEEKKEAPKSKAPVITRQEEKVCEEIVEINKYLHSRRKEHIKDCNYIAAIDIILLHIQFTLAGAQGTALPLDIIYRQTKQPTDIALAHAVEVLNKRNPVSKLMAKTVGKFFSSSEKGEAAVEQAGLPQSAIYANRYMELLNVLNPKQTYTPNARN